MHYIVVYTTHELKQKKEAKMNTFFIQPAELSRDELETVIAELEGLGEGWLVSLRGDTWTDNDGTELDFLSNVSVIPTEDYGVNSIWTYKSAKDLCEECKRLLSYYN